MKNPLIILSIILIVLVLIGGAVLAVQNNKAMKTLGGVNYKKEQGAFGKISSWITGG